MSSLLFLIQINDFPDAEVNTKPAIYADDSSILEDWTELESNHEEITNRFEQNRTRSYTADAVWYRQPSGQPTNMLNLNKLRVEKVS